MSENLDQIDQNILRQLQKDASQTVESIAEKVHLSKNACWRRIKALEDRGLIEKRVAILNAEGVGLGQLVFVLVHAKEHSPEWLDLFKKEVQRLPQIVGAYRTAGDLDYLLKVRVADVKGYDAFYQRLISLVPHIDVSASFVMEVLSETTELPLGKGAW